MKRCLCTRKVSLQTILREPEKIIDLKMFCVSVEYWLFKLIWPTIILQIASRELTFHVNHKLSTWYIVQYNIWYWYWDTFDMVVFDIIRRPAFVLKRWKMWRFHHHKFCNSSKSVYLRYVKMLHVQLQTHLNNLLFAFYVIRRLTHHVHLKCCEELIWLKVRTCCFLTFKLFIDVTKVTNWLL